MTPLVKHEPEGLDYAQHLHRQAGSILDGALLASRGLTAREAREIDWLHGAIQDALRREAVRELARLRPRRRDPHEPELGWPGLGHVLFGDTLGERVGL